MHIKCVGIILVNSVHRIHSIQKQTLIKYRNEMGDTHAHRRNELDICKFYCSNSAALCWCFWNDAKMLLLRIQLYDLFLEWCTSNSIQFNGKNQPNHNVSIKMYSKMWKTNCLPSFNFSLIENHKWSETKTSRLCFYHHCFVSCLMMLSNELLVKSMYIL